MITIESLREFGADVDTGVKRCAGKEDFYLMLVGTVDNKGFLELKEAINAKDYDKAFECAHGLKGALSNLALTPLSEPISEMTELLRAKEEVDYSTYLEKLEAEYEKFMEMK